MALLTAQLLFVEQPDPRSVQLDVIVLDRLEAAASPEVGAPLTFALELPTDDDQRQDALKVLSNWARQRATVEMNVRSHHGVDVIDLRRGVANIGLRPQVAPS
jgi:hypothetical protein